MIHRVIKMRFETQDVQDKKGIESQSAFPNQIEIKKRLMAYTKA